MIWVLGIVVLYLGSTLTLKPHLLCLTTTMASYRSTRAPEKDTLQKEFATITNSIAHGTDLAQFGNYLSSNNFLSADAVRGYLDVTSDSKLEKTSKLMMAVRTNITSAKRQEDITQRFDDFLKMLYEELALEDLAERLADKNHELSGRFQ